MSDVFDRIEKLNDGSMKFGTERTRALLDRLGSPDDGLKIIHIAGTNGKGSIAEYITQILIAAGKKTGTFTSPAVLNYFEQFRINGNQIDKTTMSEYFEEVYAFADGCTAFEVQTAGALYAFYKEGCEYAVVECGLGGLLDSTNAINKKELAVISSIGLEHTAFLGDTIQKICAHKAGIINNCPALVNALQPEEARKYFTNLNVLFADKSLQILESNFCGQRFLYDGKEYKIQMAGFAQVYNAATAIEAAKVLGIDNNSIQVGISQAKLAGRLQYFNAKGNTYIVDGGHNPAGFAPLAEVLKKYNGKEVTVIFGCLSDKDIDKNLQTIQGLAARIIAVKPQSARAMDIEKITAACRKYFNSVTEESNVGCALEKSCGIVVVCGSFTLVKEAVNWIEKRL